MLRDLVKENPELDGYLRPGYRVRLINLRTLSSFSLVMMEFADFCPYSIWQFVLPECEDRTLALCDFMSIDVSDLIPTDRVYLTHSQGIYHLKYNEAQRWFWLPRQRSEEPFLFMTCDSKSAPVARCT